jgi:hypothetical protein
MDWRRVGNCWFPRHRRPLSINVFSDRETQFYCWLVFRHGEGLAGHVEFSALSGVHPMIEKYSLDKVAEACEQCTVKVRFRVVLTFD